MERLDILHEIRRTAELNGGKPLGAARFTEETGIRQGDWFGKFWKSWSDALAEAGLTPNQMRAPIDEQIVLTSFLALIRELGRFPVKGDLMLKRRRDPAFPTHNVFLRRFASKRQGIAKLTEYCRNRPEYEDVAAILSETSLPHARDSTDPSSTDGASGFVYLVQHGSRRQFKIGRTNNPLRREGQVAVELPEELKPIHKIQTDDPAGVEAYWHRRFADKRLKGEWFNLSPADVRAFRRWQRII